MSDTSTIGEWKIEEMDHTGSGHPDDGHFADGGDHQIK
jgi:hypothetical protein